MLNITAIAAYAKSNRAIGLAGDIPWHSSGDLSRFRSATMGHTLIMGRSTAESIGKALPGRDTIVLTRNSNWKMAGVRTAQSVDEVLDMAWGLTNVMVAGGEMVYKQFYPYYTHMLLTIVDAEVDGDRFFPSYDYDEWSKVGSASFDEEDPPSRTVLLKRVRSL